MSSKKGKLPLAAGATDLLGKPPGPRFLLALGTYDGGIVGYRVDAAAGTSEKEKTANKQKATLTRIFAVSAHSGCVKALCAPGKMLVSGSTDESLRIYDLFCLEERGSLLVGHHSSISALASAGPSLCLSLDEERRISVWRVSDWSLLKTINITTERNGKKQRKGALQQHSGHKLSVHPSSKLALCLDGTNSLHLINLLKGNCAATFALDEPTMDVSWSPDGELFATLASKTVRVMETVGGRCRIALKRPAVEPVPWSAMCFGSDNILYLGTSTGEIECFRIPEEAKANADKGSKNAAKEMEQTPKESQPVGVLKGLHASRVKSIVVTSSNVLGGGPKKFVASCDSSGLLVLWTVETDKKGTQMHFEPVASVETGCRLTCLVTTAYCGSKKERFTVSHRSPLFDAAPYGMETDAEAGTAKKKKKTIKSQEQKRKAAKLVDPKEKREPKSAPNDKQGDRKRQRFS